MASTKVTVTVTVPEVNSVNLADDEKITKAVGDYDRLSGAADKAKGEIVLFLYAVEMFREGMTRKQMVDTFGAKSPALAKAKKVVCHYLAEMFGPETTVGYAQYNEAVAVVRAEHGTVWQAYRDLFPTTRTEKTLADKLSDLFREYRKETGNDSEEFGLLALGVAQSVEMSEGDDEDDDAQ